LAQHHADRTRFSLNRSAAWLCDQYFDQHYSKNGFACSRILSHFCLTPANRPVGEDGNTMNDDIMSPLDRLMVLTFGAMASWIAVGGVAFGASKLVQHLF
jgi:hypothetical protein